MAGEAQQSICVLFLQRTRATQIIPCTVSQLMSASQVDEAFKVGDVEVAQVKWGQSSDLKNTQLAMFN